MITRCLSVPPSLTFANFHTVIQAAFGWTKSHAHSFDVKVPSTNPEFPLTAMCLQPSYGYGVDDDPVDSMMPKTENESKWSLKDVFEKTDWRIDAPSYAGAPQPVEIGEGQVQIDYEYDHGDSWEHQITLLGRATKNLHRVVAADDIDGVICLGGEGHPCAEDCGGAPGWEGLKEAFKKPRGDPELKNWYKTQCFNGDKKGLDPYKWSLFEVNDELCAMRF